MPDEKTETPKRSPQTVMLALFEHLHMIAGKHPAGTALLNELSAMTPPEPVTETPPAMRNP